MRIDTARELGGDELKASVGWAEAPTGPREARSDCKLRAVPTSSENLKLGGRRDAKKVRKMMRELDMDELKSVSGGGFGSAAAGVGATGAGAAQVDFFAQYYYFVYQPAPPLVCGDGICS